MIIVTAKKILSRVTSKRTPPITKTNGKMAIKFKCHLNYDFMITSSFKARSIENYF